MLTYPYPPSSSSGRPSPGVSYPKPDIRSAGKQRPPLRHGATSDDDEEKVLRRTSLSIPFRLFRSYTFPSFFHTPPSSPLDLRDRTVEYLSAGERANPRQERCPSEANPAKNNPGPTRCPARSFASSPVRPPSPSHAP